MTIDEIMNCQSDNRSNWDNLLQNYRNGAIIPFVGAGCSVPTYSLWSETLKNIMGNADKIENAEFYSCLGRGAYEDACEYVYNKLQPNAFLIKIKKEFSDKKIEKNGISDSLIELANAFQGTIITTNFEKCIEKAYKNSFEGIYLLSNMKENYAVVTDVIRTNTHCLLKIHGDINDLNSLVFTKKQYETKYDYDAFAYSLERIFESKSLLFLGCSLGGNDRYIDLIKKIVGKVNEGSGVIENYAFLPLPGGLDNDENKKKLTSRIEQLNSWGIIPIWYPTDKYESVAILLRSLYNKSVESENSLKKNDKTSYNKHYNVFLSEYKIEDVFISDCYDIAYIDDSLDIRKASDEKMNFENAVKYLKSEKLIYIEGGYGTGKTILSLMLQKKLADESYITFYFDAEDLPNITFEELNQYDNREVFIFIDAIDKLIGYDGTGTAELKEVSKSIAYLCNLGSCNVHFVLNSRKYYKLNSDDSDKFSTLFAYEYLTQTEYNKMFVLQTIGFKSEQCNAFFSKLNPRNTKMELSMPLIKQWNKKAPNSCKTPLFAYVIANYYYEKNINTLPDEPLVVYNEFVDKTINGRFQTVIKYEQIITKKDYLDLLKKIAIQMIYEMKHNIVYKEDTNENDYLGNQEVYAIDIEKFDQEIKNGLSKYVDIMKNPESALSKIINNYFFNLYQLSDGKCMVRFSDINVLCCFATMYLFELLTVFFDIINESDIDDIINKNAVKFGYVELQPQMMDFLISKIQMLEEEKQIILNENLFLVIKRYFGRTIQKVYEVKMLLVFYIIYIKLKKDSYKQNGTQHFFKQFYRLCKTAKALNINGEHKEGKHRYLVERYFMKCSFIHCVFKRLNLKFFNFSESVITDTVFIQCNFHNNVFDYCELNNIKFLLCMFDRAINGFKVKNKVIFKSSIFDKAQISSIMFDINGEIVFEKCSISNIQIRKIDSRTNKIIFKNCVLSDIKITDCKNIFLEIDNCIILNNEKIKCNHSDVILSSRCKEQETNINLGGNSNIIIKEDN